MVRVRKNANTMSDKERERFRDALATLNDKGNGPFQIYRDMHTAAAIQEAHGNDGFLPWHRAYLLDLERDLQQIDRSVTIPYWKFDVPAQNLFTPEFLGATQPNGTMDWSAGNPLQFWRTDNGTPIQRRSFFNPQTGHPSLLSEGATLALGAIYRSFVTMEGNPHGDAHISFNGAINNPATAPKDPLFFLLHSNVDRLWAKWQ